MTETARVYGGSLYELAQEEHLEEEILSEMKEIRALFRENPEAFQRRYFAAHNIAEAVVTSAASLSKEQEELLKKKLETMSGKTVVMELKTDPSVLAGVRVELDGKLFDGTVKGRLAELSRRISDTVV